MSTATHNINPDEDVLSAALAKLGVTHFTAAELLDAIKQEQELVRQKEQDKDTLTSNSGMNSTQ